MRTLVDTSDVAARADLRSQIARLEARGAKGAGTGAGPRLLSLGELEAVRDALASDRTCESGGQSPTWRTFEAMLANPKAHKWQQISRADLGVPGCGSYRVAPRLGIIGMLAGWWHITLSSGCP